MKKWLFIPIVIILVIVLDLSNRIFCNYVIKHCPENTDMFYRCIYQLNTHQSDILITGASRASHHYNPYIIEDSLLCSAYNAGYDGMNINFSYLTIKRAINNGPVKIVLLDLSAPQITDEYSYSLQNHKPYYWENSDVREYFDQIKPWSEKIFMCSSFYQFNSKLFNNFRCLLTKPKPETKGYNPLPCSDKVIDSTFKIHDSDIAISDISLSQLNKISTLCKNKGIRLILILSPALVYNPKVACCLEKYAIENDVIFWNFNNYEPIVTNNSLFKDAGHMNSKGADIYTKVLVSKIKEAQLL